MAKAAKSKPKEKEVATRPEAGLPAVMNMLKKHSGQGFEEADKDAYAIPFMRILQKLSPQLDKNEEAYVKGAEEGQFINTVTSEVYGDSLLIIPVRYERQFIEWLPNRGGFKAAHGNDPAILDKVVNIDEKNNSYLENGNIIQDTRNFYVLLADRLADGPIILSLTSSGIKHSRKWMSLMKALKLDDGKTEAPMFSGVWSVKTIRNTNDEGSWYMVGDKNTTAIKFDRWVNAEELEAALAAQDLVTSGTAQAAYDSLNEAQGEKEDDIPF